MLFEIVGEIRDVETFASGSGIQELPRVIVMSGHTFAICIKNEDYEASLELRTLYEVLPDPKSEQLGMVRVVDESGEDYLYPQAFFVQINLPEMVEEQVLLAA